MGRKGCDIFSKETPFESTCRPISPPPRTFHLSPHSQPRPPSTFVHRFGDRNGGGDHVTIFSLVHDSVSFVRFTAEIFPRNAVSLRHALSALIGQPPEAPPIFDSTGLVWQKKKKKLGKPESLLGQSSSRSLSVGEDHVQLSLVSSACDCFCTDSSERRRTVRESENVVFVLARKWRARIEGPGSKRTRRLRRHRLRP